MSPSQPNIQPSTQPVVKSKGEFLRLLQEKIDSISRLIAKRLDQRPGDKNHTEDITLRQNSLTFTLQPRGDENLRIRVQGRKTILHINSDSQLSHPEVLLGEGAAEKNLNMDWKNHHEIAQISAKSILKIVSECEALLHPKNPSR